MAGLAKGLMLRLAIWALLAVLIGVGYFIVVTIQDGPLQAAQAAAQNRFGADAIKLCALGTGTVKLSKVTVPANARVGVINMDDNTVFERFDSALSPDRQAKTASDLTTLLCMREVPKVINTDRYGSQNSSSSTVYTCDQKSRNVKAYLVDVRSRSPFAAQDFQGGDPPECPNETDHNLTVQGELPDPADVIDWAVSKLGK